VVLHTLPPSDAPVRLRLDWEDGQVTELLTRVEHVGGTARVRVAQLEIQRVEGDWRHFLSYVATSSL